MANRTKILPPDHTTFLVRNRSSRLGVPVCAVAVHTTQGVDIPHSIKDLTSLDNWFDLSASDASAHTGVDGDGNSRVWVHSNWKSWSCLNANPFTCNIEFIGKAGQPAIAWEDAQIHEGARWAAYWCVKYNIPAQRGIVRNVHGQCVCTKKGIITHKDVSDAGFGNHQDPGPTFPMSRFIQLTQWYKKNGWVVSQ
jgi:N-acetyl-anhydromuramyl-L-alanine amidase AmpD